MVHKLAETKEDVREQNNDDKSEEDASMVENDDNDVSGEVSLKGETIRFGDTEIRKDSLTVIIGLTVLFYEVFE